MERYQNNLQDQFGSAISGVTVTVRDLGGTLATLYSDDGVSGKANPFTNDPDGEFFFYAANDRYNIFFTGPITDQKDDVLLYDPDGAIGSIRVLTDIATATPPTSEAVTGSFQIWDNDNDDVLFNLGFVSSPSLRLRNYMHGAGFSIECESSAGSVRTMVNGDPDTETSIWASGIKTFSAYQANRVRVLADITTATPPSTETPTVYYEFSDSDASDTLGRIGYETVNILRITNLMHGGGIQLRAEDAASGSNKIMFSADPDGTAGLYYNGIARFLADTGGRVAIRSDTNTDTEIRRLHFEYQDGTDRALIGFSGTAEFQIANLINGAKVSISANDAGGTLRTILDADPDAVTILRGDTDVNIQTAAGESSITCVANGSVRLYYDNVLRITTESGGLVRLRSDGNTDAENRLLIFTHADATERARIGNEGGDALVIRNAIHGGNLTLTAEDAVGTVKSILVGDPDGITTLRGDTNMELRVANGELGLQLVGNGAANIYYDNQTNLRTSNEAGSDIGMGAEVRHNDDAFYPVGMNVVPENSTLDTGNDTLALNLIGKMIHYNSATARSLFFNNDSTIKVGAMFAVKVGPSAGVLTGDGGTGVQIRWWNGSGWTTTAAAGNITIGVGDYTIWKETDTLYHISGPTLS